MNCDKYSS